ncbi:MAG: UDP-N-acetylglucosamine 2-epimerase (hydrolyzing) [Candidatus Brocadiales bacterium]|nr:UDP-N-acetylglucosamine 2-epimerase (hydrolyzing) [Candidatus Brocadiales bacterium]
MKILCITGTRADYPRVKSVLKEIKQRTGFDLHIVVTGSHLLEEYGYSAQEIIDDGFKIDKMVPMFTEDYNSPFGMAKAAATCTRGVAYALEEIKPDLVLLTVDRVETLAAAVAVSLMNFPIAHIQGGEVTGTIDESIRHAVTKLSHIHFPATEDAAERIIRMGERPDMVFNVGCPYIDIINSVEKKSKQELSKKYKFDLQKPLIIFTQHSVTTEYGLSTKQIKNTLNSLKIFPDCEIIAFSSNTDAGGKEIVESVKKEKNFIHIPNMTSSDFLSLMAIANVMVGNSSAAIREAPSFHLPAVNIGSRQQGRLRARNVIDVDYKEHEITSAIRKALYDEDFIKTIKGITNPYGDGKSAKRIVDILENISIEPDLLQKRITYEL